MKKRYAVVLWFLLFSTVCYGIMRVLLHLKLNTLNKKSFIAYWTIEAFAVIANYYFVFFLFLLGSAFAGFIVSKFHFKNKEAQSGFGIALLLITLIATSLITLVFIRH